MSTKGDPLPTISIKGKDYVLVKDRILAFHEAYPKGSIRTEKTSSPDGRLVAFKAFVYPDVGSLERVFIGHAEEIRGGAGVNATSACENAETSAVGRALAMLGIGVLESVASADEVNKALVAERRAPSAAQPRPYPQAQPATQSAVPRQPFRPASEAQKNLIRKLSAERGLAVGDLDSMVIGEAKEKIDSLLAMPPARVARMPAPEVEEGIPIIADDMGPLPPPDDWLG